MSKLAVCYIVHDDTYYLTLRRFLSNPAHEEGCFEAGVRNMRYYLTPSIAPFQEAGEVFVFVSRVPRHDQPGDWQAAA